MATVTDRNRLREEEELAIGPLLARAKLFRVRQQWEEAIAACTDALRRYPMSITACSLLGEIYEAQGRLEDAAQWYGMALERDPQSNSDRSGLERVTAAQRARQVVEPAILKASHPPATVPRPVAEKTLEWFDRLFPPGDSRSIARMLYAVSGVIAVLLIVSWTVFYAFFQNRTRRPLPELPTPDASLPGLPTPVVVEPSVRVSPSPSPSQSPSPSARPSAEPSTGVIANAMDDQLMTALNRLLNGTFFVQSLTRTGDGHINLGVLVPAGETVDRSRTVVLQAAAVTAKLAGQADPSLRTASVRAEFPAVPNTNVGPTLVFSGDVPETALQNIDPLSVTYMEILSRFTRIQWEGPLAPGGEAPTSSPSPVPSPSPGAGSSGGEGEKSAAGSTGSTSSQTP